MAWPIHKKGDVTDPGNYRLITLMSVTCKLFERLLNTRLTAWTTSDASQQHIAENQVGFQADRSTTDHLYATTETARMRTAHGRPTYACFVDCRKAFPSVFKAGMLVKLHRQGVRGKFWRMLQSMYIQQNRDESADGPRERPYAGRARGHVLPNRNGST